MESGRGFYVPPPWSCPRSLRSNSHSNPSIQTTAQGQNIRAWPFSLSSSPYQSLVLIRTQRPTGKIPPTRSDSVSRFRRPHQQNRHISAILLSALSNRCPAQTTNPISKKKSPNRLSKPNCPLNNILNQRQSRVITATYGDFCFRVVQGSSSSTSGGYVRPTTLAAVMTMRFVCPE